MRADVPLLAMLIAIACVMSASAAAKPRSPRAPRLVFGIYPGGAAGTVGPSGPTRPEDPRLRLAALQQLRTAGRPFILHLYALYTGSGGWSADQQVGHEVQAYGRAGFETEVVLGYRPGDAGSSADVRGFVGFVRSAVRSLGPRPGFSSLQVTNEANVGGSPDTSDGYYAGAEDALIAGVIAAKGEARQARFNRIAVGFNVAAGGNRSEPAFWRYLGRRGGRRFVDALDWVGVDIFPGTWGPPLASGGVAAAAGRFVNTALRRLRFTYMPLSGIPRTVPLRVTENGYPTGPGRTPATQVTVMTASIQAVYRARSADNITGYRWFDLRDADSASSSFESQYGLLRDDYAPKPAFAVYRALVARFSR